VVKDRACEDFDITKLQQTQKGGGDGSTKQLVKNMRQQLHALLSRFGNFNGRSTGRKKHFSCGNSWEEQGKTVYTFREAKEKVESGKEKRETFSS